METYQLLSYVLFTPLIGALLLLVFQRERGNEIRIFGLVISIITLEMKELREEGLAFLPLLMLPPAFLA